MARIFERLFPLCLWPGIDGIKRVENRIYACQQFAIQSGFEVKRSSTTGSNRPIAVIRVVNNCGCMARCALLPQRLLVDINDGLTSYFSLFKHFVGSLSLVKGETKLIYQRLQLTRFCQLGRLAQDFAMVSALFARKHWQ